MLGFKSTATARVILGGIEMIHMMRKGQAKYTYKSQPSFTEQVELDVA
jgi:transposase-like protein